jgi:hypothetical protein
MLLCCALKDTAVIVGFNTGYDETDKLFFPTSYEVASTVAAYNTLFCNEYKVCSKQCAMLMPCIHRLST